MLGDVTLNVAGKTVEPVDPLFLTPGARYYLPKGGAIEVYNQMIPVRYYQDEGKRAVFICRTSKRPANLIPENEKTLAVGAIEVRIVRFPPGFLGVQERQGGVRRKPAGSRYVRRGAGCPSFGTTARSKRSTCSRGRCVTCARPRRLAFAAGLRLPLGYRGEVQPSTRRGVRHRERQADGPPYRGLLALACFGAVSRSTLCSRPKTIGR